MADIYDLIDELRRRRQVTNVARLPSRALSRFASSSMPPARGLGNVGRGLTRARERASEQSALRRETPGVRNAAALIARLIMQQALLHGEIAPEGVETPDQTI